VCGLVGRWYLCHPERQFARACLVPQPKQLGMVGDCPGDPDRVQMDGAVGRAVPATDDGQPAAVPDRREDQLV